MYKSNEDLYQDYINLIDRLKENGETEWAGYLESALYGATSGEIFGDIRIALRKFLKTTLPSDLSVTRKVNCIVKTIDDLLRS
ncbi:MAG TPA: hypothetical protein PLN69_10715 [bacterium]|nr:hypothetical protein [bacterium]